MKAAGLRGADQCQPNHPRHDERDLRNRNVIVNKLAVVWCGGGVEAQKRVKQPKSALTMSKRAEKHPDRLEPSVRLTRLWLLRAHLVWLDGEN